MKLLIFCPYYPPHIGGLESHANEFNKYLSERGMDITVFTPHFPQNTPETEIWYNKVKIIRFPAFEIISNYPLPKFWSIKFWGLFLALFKQDFNIVISRTRFFNTSLLALIYAKIKRTRWIHIEHGSDFVRLSSGPKTLLAKIYDFTFGYLIFRYADQNISISKAVQKFVNKFDRRESPVIYRGLDTEEMNKIQPDRETRDKFKNKTIISFVGRLYKWKGTGNSIKAIKSLPEELREKIVFLIIGDGEDFGRLKKTSNDEASIVMLGNLPREKAIAILKATDIYIHSSHPGGGLSTSLLEAMYCGCAVIATPNEGADEVIKNNENGILLANSTEMIEALKELLQNPDKMIDFGKNAKNYIEKKINWKNSIEKYAKIFRK